MSRKLISWNVNGLRACVGKGTFYDFVNEEDPDVLCLQETKLQEGQIELDLPQYYTYWNYAEKKGYSGTAILIKEKPLCATYGLGIPEFDHEGRVITLEFPQVFLIDVYVPNSKQQLERLSYRMKWEDAFFSYVKKLEETKPVIYCGDLNVAHEEIDLKNPSSNHHNAGFTDEERAKMTRALSNGLTDTWRYFYPDTTGVYSWWSYRFHARQSNAGWRIDYFIVSDALVPCLKDAMIYTKVMGSDHCPIGLLIE